MTVFKKTRLQELPESCWDCKDRCKLSDDNYFVSPSKRMDGCPLLVKMTREEAIDIIKEMREEDATSEHIAMALGFGEGNEE